MKHSPRKKPEQHSQILPCWWSSCDWDLYNLHARPDPLDMRSFKAFFFTTTQRYLHLSRLSQNTITTRAATTQRCERFIHSPGVCTVYTIYSVYTTRSCIYICKQLICLNAQTIKNLYFGCDKLPQMRCWHTKTQRRRNQQQQEKHQRVGKIYKFMLDLRCCGSIYMGNWPKCWPTLTHLRALSLRQRLLLHLLLFCDC